MNNLVILTGPTAVGKTALSVRLAHEINGEIISADCMQVYKGMDIGTAKVMPEEMDGIKHYLIDCIDPTEDFHVVRFKEMAQNAISDIVSRGKTPIICGGTGFYIQALLYDIEFTEDARDDEYRAYLNGIAVNDGVEKLHSMLKDIDPQSFSSIPAANVKRVIRALEYYKITGKTISSHNEEQRNRAAAYNFAYFVLNDDRDKLYQRIDKRVDIMMENGLLDEVHTLLNLGIGKDAIALDGIGYKEIIGYLDNKYSLEEAIDLIKQNSRHYAKRQLTWFRRERDVIWLDKSTLTNDDLLMAEIKKTLIERGII